MPDHNPLGNPDKKPDREKDPAYEQIRRNDYMRAQQQLLREAEGRRSKLQKTVALLFFLLFLALGTIGYFQREPILLYLGLKEEPIVEQTEAVDPDPVRIKHARNNIVIVQGVPVSETYAAYQSGGTGFLAAWKDKVFLVTNIHVLAALEKPHFLTVSGHAIPVALDSIYLAANEDIALVEIENYDEIFPVRTEGKEGESPDREYIYTPFTIADNIDFTVKEGDGVTIYGNTLGKRIVQKDTGKIEGLGANILQHSAPTKPGNSGSPIIHDASGEVIGVDTYNMIYRDGKRREESYGYRFDTIEKWEPIGSWEAFRRTSEKLVAIELRTNDLIKLANGTLDPAKYKETTFQNIWFTFFNRLRDIQRGGTVSTSHALSKNEQAYRSYQHFLQSVRSLVYEDIDAFLAANGGDWNYNYFRIRALSEKNTREQLEEAINQSINNYDAVIRTMR